MTRSAALIVVAAGEGRRLGQGRHKALVPLDGRPLVEHTLRRLLAVPELTPVVLVGHPDDRAPLTALLAGLPRPVRLVDGGARRQDSVRAGLAALESKAGVVLVHDAARPFVPVEALPALIDAATEDGCAILAVPVADTIKATDPGRPDHVARTLPRDDLRAAQTPQAFRGDALRERLRHAEAEGHTVTDEARLFEAAGRPVRLVPGSRLNFKITTEDDLRLAEALLTSRAARP